ncbi:hypothetical protein HK098_007248 [Nowakowskiella sp. JEL0407]|nr:hypothetical protein HK098_007248 [Nowakowskiella sp. JEL0407]
MPKQFPSAETRRHCWKARDQYFTCLDAHSLWLDGLPVPASKKDCLNLDPANPLLLKAYARGGDAHKKGFLKDKAVVTDQKVLFACESMRLAFEKECLPSWSAHFSGLRVKELQTKYLAEKVLEEDKKREQEGNDFWERVQKK